MGLLSRYPITDRERLTDPAGIEARVALPGETTLAVVNAHPLPGRITTGPLGIPVSFDASVRDAAIERLRTRVDALLASRTPVIVAGDYNVVPAEPAYRRLADGLRDSHAERGHGPGWTWRPTQLEGLHMGVLRIDYILTSVTVGIEASGVDCTRAGDHCVVSAVLDTP
jgi:endonuclease/exonuclease/phosphatase family metal-dependent hydrolase